ncbi:PREDICTED: CLAVATA3/ESR (CLE)-related protein 2 [Tarenaya hassleriana]|uniref:CLAVATA3/ESR (CLE)-related protein 2 n=1 Tax=Tarenaya hassleriana TaxID=28532 RepID=UPI0008FD4715|nr:PREDICTED: CLAVATA3/ESR (CLE)-related protein 2 [Tarenaya hassleriana]
MKYSSQRTLFLIFLIFLFAVICISDGRNLRPDKSASREKQEESEVWVKEPKRTMTADFYRDFRRTPTGATVRILTGQKPDPVYGVSGREVPAGPNPLHNR